MNESQTLLLYISIIVISTIFAFFSQHRKINIISVDANTFRKPFYAISFLIPWFFFAFAGMSNDYVEYQYIFTTVTWENFSTLWIEPGYALLNLIIKFFTSDSHVAISVIKTLLMLLIYKTIYDYKNKISVGFAVMGFLCYLYLDAFCMLRINLTAAILLFAIDLYDVHKRKGLALSLVLIALSIHYSVVIFILAIVAYLLCVRRDRLSVMFFASLILVLLIGRVYAIPLIEKFTSSVSILAKYGRKYSAINRTGSGIMQYVLHLPLVYVFYTAKRHLFDKNCEDHRIYMIGIVLSLFSLFFGTMGYSFEVIGRSYVFFIFLWIVLLPRYYINVKNEMKSNIGATFLLITIWDFAKLYFYIEGGSLLSSGIECYKFMWQI